MEGSVGGDFKGWYCICQFQLAVEVWHLIEFRSGFEGSWCDGGLQIRMVSIRLPTRMYDQRLGLLCVANGAM